MKVYVEENPPGVHCLYVNDAYVGAVSPMKDTDDFAYTGLAFVVVFYLADRKTIRGPVENLRLGLAAMLCMHFMTYTELLVWKLPEGATPWIIDD